MPATKICKFKSFRAKSSEATNQQLHNWQAGVISLSVAMIFDYCVRIYIRLYIDDYRSGHHENKKKKRCAKVSLGKSVQALLPIRAHQKFSISSAFISDIIRELFIFEFKL